MSAGRTMPDTMPVIRREASWRSASLTIAHNAAPAGRANRQRRTKEHPDLLAYLELSLPLAAGLE